MKKSLFASRAQLLRASAFVALSLFSASAAYAVDLPDGMGKVTGDFRYRYEFADDASRPEDARASTARIRLGYETPTWDGLKFFGEVEAVRHIGNTEFDDGLNGRTQYPRIADPEMTGINQLYADFKKNSIHARLGRQPLTFDNQRFVAWSKTRQNDTTHDALLLDIEPLKNLKLAYAYSRQLNRFSGERTAAGDYEGDMHFVNAHYDVTDGLGFSVYNYSLDFEGAERNLSSNTTGILAEWEAQGEGWQPYASVEFAHQVDAGDSTLSYAENYTGLEAGLQKGKATVSLGYERLGGNGTNAALQTPLASLHNVYGWTEKFGTTPVDGLQHTNLNISMPFDLPWEGQTLTAFGNAHRFDSVEDSRHYGDEAGIGLTYTPLKGHDITVKAARYFADDLFADTDKVFVYYDLKF